MKIIVNGKERILRLLGKQRLQNVQYRMMRFVLQTECSDGILFHNVITGQMVILDYEEANAIKSLPCKPNDTLQLFIESYFLVPVEYDEKDTVVKLRRILNRLFPCSGVSTYTIFTTTNCNARCFYCYESNLERINMSERTADLLVKYIIEHNTGDNILKLHWFGGEPLVCVDRIDQICNALNIQGQKYVSSMTSNGYLFTDSIIERAVNDWKLGSVQITLDGTEQIYNKTKSYISAVGSPYQRVIRNICLLMQHDISVIIRLNLDKHNKEDLNNLINELYDTIKSHDRIEIYTHVLFEDAGFEPILRDDSSRDDLYICQNELNTLLEKLGLSKNNNTLPVLKMHNCMADIDDSVVVYPDGRLFKCEHVEIGDEFANISTDFSNMSGVEKYRIITEKKECSICPIYPSCILLKNCQGVQDKNNFTCKYYIDSYKRSMVKEYKKRISEKSRLSNSRFPVNEKK